MFFHCNCIERYSHFIFFFSLKFWIYVCLIALNYLQLSKFLLYRNFKKNFNGCRGLDMRVQTTVKIPLYSQAHKLYQSLNNFNCISISFEPIIWFLYITEAYNFKLEIPEKNNTLNAFRSVVTLSSASQLKKKCRCHHDKTNV